MYLTQSCTEVQPLPSGSCLCVHASTTATAKLKPLTTELCYSPDGGHLAPRPLSPPTSIHSMLQNDTGVYFPGLTSNAWQSIPTIGVL